MKKWSKVKQGECNEGESKVKCVNLYEFCHLYSFPLFLQGFLSFTYINSNL